jgi:hypothetical protein
MVRPSGRVQVARSCSTESTIKSTSAVYALAGNFLLSENCLVKQWFLHSEPSRIDFSGTLVVMGQENDLQIRLTKRWLEHGLTVDCHRLCLLAWEVAPQSWNFNGLIKGQFQSASDFLFLDGVGALWVMDIKRWEKLTFMRTFEACCQVTIYAVEIEKTRTLQNLEKVYGISLAHDRHVGVPIRGQTFQEAHRKFFAEFPPVPDSDFGIGQVHRVLAVKSPEPACFKEFNTLDLKGLQSKVIPAAKSNKFHNGILKLNSLENITTGMHFLELDPND